MAASRPMQLLSQSSVCLVQPACHLAYGKIYHQNHIHLWIQTGIMKQAAKAVTRVVC